MQGCPEIQLSLHSQLSTVGVLPSQMILYSVNKMRGNYAGSYAKPL